MLATRSERQRAPVSSRPPMATGRIADDPSADLLCPIVGCRATKEWCDESRTALLAEAFRPGR